MMQHESEISPAMGDDVYLGKEGEEPKPGYEAITIGELRRRYGNFINHENLHMPVAQLLGIMTDLARLATSYKGVHICKLPEDCWTLQEIIWQNKPTVIIEIGNQAGGSTLWLRDLLNNTHNGAGAPLVIGIDISRERLDPSMKHVSGIEWIDGRSQDEDVFEQVSYHIEPEDKVMVIDDGSHHYDETMENLKMYGPLVTIGQYYIVEDTIYNEFIPHNDPDINSYGAVIDFLVNGGNKDFRYNRVREKWFITQNPVGYLKKIR